MRFLILLLAPAAFATSISTSFEGGSLGRVEKISDLHFRLGAKGEKDRDGRNRQANWYYFRVDGAPKKELTLEIVDLPGEYNYQPNRGAITKDTPPVISYDGKTWEHIRTFTFDAAEPKMVLHVLPTRSRFWIAHTPPYTNETLARLRKDIAELGGFSDEVIGKTVGGRDLVLWTITDGSQTPKKTAWLMFRQHSWETGSSWTGEGAVRALLGNDETGRRLRRGFIWKILPLCDPDGVARGGVRFNANGYDLNRNWDVIDPVQMPEITAQRNAVKRWLDGGHTVDFFLSLHNTETAEYLEGPPEESVHGPIAPMAQRLFQTLSTTTTFAPSRPLFYADVTTTPGMVGRMVIQGLYRDAKIPAFLMEQRVSYNEKLGHLPEIPDRVRFGRELVQAIAQTLDAEIKPTNPVVVLQP